MPTWYSIRPKNSTWKTARELYIFKVLQEILFRVYAPDVKHNEGEVKILALILLYMSCLNNVTIIILLKINYISSRLEMLNLYGIILRVWNYPDSPTVKVMYFEYCGRFVWYLTKTAIPIKGIKNTLCQYLILY